jgi:integrase
VATIRKRGKNSYQIRVSACYDGTKQIMKSMTFKPDPNMTERQAEKALNAAAVEFENQVQRGMCLDGSIKFSEFSALWMKDYANKQLSPRTAALYEHELKRINAAIGHIHLDRLQPQQLLQLYDNLGEERISDKVRYFPKEKTPGLIASNHAKRAEIAAIAGISVRTVDTARAGHSVAEKSARGICKALKIKLSDGFTAGSEGSLSKKTVLSYHKLISSILMAAVKDYQIITSNPAQRCRAPKPEPHESAYLDENSAAHLLELLQKEPIEYHAAVSLLLYSGLRRGELLALRFSDLDFDNHLLSVCRSAQYLPGKGVFVKEPKTKGSARTIKLPAVAFDMLRDYRKWQTERRISVGNQWHDNDLLFSQWNGELMYPTTLSMWFKKFIDRTDLSHITLHSLRHSNATLMIASGVDIRTVSARLGHADANITMSVYAHAIQSADAAAAETLENILDPLHKKSNIG